LQRTFRFRQTESLAPLFSGSGEPTKREPLPQSFKRAARQLRMALDTNVKVKNGAREEQDRN